MLLAEKKMEGGRNRGKNERLGTLPRESHAECHSLGFPQGEFILGVLEMPGTPQKKAGSIHKPIPETGQNMTKHVTTKRFLPFLTPSHARPSDAIGSSLEGHEKNMEEIG